MILILMFYNVIFEIPRALTCSKPSLELPSPPPPPGVWSMYFPKFELLPSIYMSSPSFLELILAQTNGLLFWGRSHTDKNYVPGSVTK
jgi:hypothetical protein